LRGARKSSVGYFQVDFFCFTLDFALWRGVLEYPFSSLEETIQQNLLGFDTTAGSSPTPHQLLNGSIKMLKT
jgi:hypothetical protein